MAQSKNNNTGASIKNARQQQQQLMQIKPEDAMSYIAENEMLADFCMFADSKKYNIIGLYSIIEKPRRYADLFAEFFKNPAFYAKGTTEAVN